jgi:hypothetical protein
MKVLGYGGLVVFGLLLAWMGISALTERGIKEPRYEVERKADGYEVRYYESYLVAAAYVPPATRQPLRAGFRMLSDYIGGANKGSLKIAMTAPVLQEDAGAEIPMTKPVLRLNAPTGSVVAFVLPADYTLQTAPVPENPDIRIREVAARRVAVMRFSGYASDETIDKKSKKLFSWLAREGLEPEGALRAAYYNPPWTPPFMRRNEVMVDLRRAGNHPKP